jgi:protein gp37
MSTTTSIPWTDHTFNLWWGCDEVSPGCAHCYARTWDKRTGGSHWGKDSPRRFFGDKHWREPLRWNKEAALEGRRHKVFCMSMGDLFEDRPDLVAERARLWPLIDETPHLDWLLLSKRPENFAKMLPWHREARAESGAQIHYPRNVWIGVTAENQAEWKRRVPLLLMTRIETRFVSMEPMLEPIDILDLGEDYDDKALDFLDWIIIGGESGPNARVFDLEWARRVMAQAQGASIKVFMKQMGHWPYDSGMLSRAQREVLEHFTPLQLRNRGTKIKPFLNLADVKGEDMDEWPKELRIREYPEGM